MNTILKILDVVALLKNIPEKNLLKGQVGTVIGILDENVFEAELVIKKGKQLQRFR